MLEPKTYVERCIVRWQIPQVEMVHRTINAKTIQENQRDWHDKIMYALHILHPEYMLSHYTLSSSKNLDLVWIVHPC